MLGLTEMSKAKGTFNIKIPSIINLLLKLCMTPHNNETFLVTSRILYFCFQTFMTYIGNWIFHPILILEQNNTLHHCNLFRVLILCSSHGVWIFVQRSVCLSVPQMHLTSFCANRHDVSCQLCQWTGSSTESGYESWILQKYLESSETFRRMVLIFRGLSVIFNWTSWHFQEQFIQDLHVPVDIAVSLLNCS